MRALFISLLVLPFPSFGQAIHTFSNSTVADAEEVNQNFQMAVHTVWSGDTYLGRVIPWPSSGTTLAVTDQRFSFRFNQWDGRLDAASNNPNNLYTNSGCSGLGYVEGKSVQPNPGYLRGVEGHVYLVHAQCDPSDPQSPPAPFCAEEQPTYKTLGAYIDFSSPIEVAVLPAGLYVRDVVSGCVPADPVTDWVVADGVFYREVQNDPSRTGVPSALIANPSLGIGFD